MKKQYLVPATLLLMLVVFAGAAFIYNKQKAEEADKAAMTNASVLVRDYSPTAGNENAKVVLVEFFDPACETCKAFHPLVKNIMDSHPGRVKLVLRYAPFHQGSDYVVAILEAARLQGKFWEALDAAYESQSVWASHGNPQPERIWMRLGSVGLDLGKVKQDMQSTEITRRIKQDIADLRQLGVNKTPSFYVNGKPLVTFGHRQLIDLVEREIANSY